MRIEEEYKIMIWWIESNVWIIKTMRDARLPSMGWYCGKYHYRLIFFFLIVFKQA